MKKLLTFFIDRSFVVNLVSVAICGVGLVMLINLTRSLAPKVDLHRIRVAATVPGSSPASVESDVTWPIEESLQGFPAVKRVRSQTVKGYTSITIELNRGKETPSRTLEKIRGRVDSIRSTLSDNVEKIETTLVNFDTVNTMGLALVNFDDSKHEHYAWLDALEEFLRQVPGIVGVDTREPKRHLYIEMDPEKLAYHGLIVGNLVRKVVGNFQATPLGAIRKNGRDIIIDIDNNARQSLEAIENLPVYSNRHRQEIKLKEVASVSFRKDRYEYITPVNGKPGVFVQPRTDVEADSITVGGYLRLAVEKFRERLPPPLQIQEMYNAGDFVNQQLDVLKINAGLGFVLVLIILTLFVGWRTAVMTAIGLPVAYLGTMIMLNYFNVHFDLISVMAMIIVLGILVDDAIIVAEKFVQNIQAGVGPRAAALDAAHSLMAPVTGTILTTIVAFLPILFINNQISDWFFAVPVVIITALIMSWIECFLILPNHLRHFVSYGRAPADRFMVWLRGLYERNLFQVLRLRYLVVILLGGFAWWSWDYLEARQKLRFDLHIGATRLEVIAVLKKSDDIPDTLEQIKPVQDFLVSLRGEKALDVTTMPGFASISGNTKRGTRYAQFNIWVKLLGQDEREVVPFLEERIRDRLPELKTAGFERLELVKKTAASDEVKQDSVTIFVTGKDSVAFDRIEARIKQEMKDVPGLQSLYTDDDRVGTSWNFVPDLGAMESYGVSTRDITTQLAGVFSPVRVGYTRIAGQQVRVYTEVQRKEDYRYEDLQNLKITTLRKLQVPVTWLGRWEKARTPRVIAHRDGRRVFEVDARYDAASTDLIKFQRAVRDRLEPLNQAFPGYVFSVESSDESQDEAKEWIIDALIIAAVAIIVILSLTLGSLTQPLLVALPVPVGFLGVVWAFYGHGMDLTLIGMVGLLGVAGVAVNDSLIMIYAMNRITGPVDGRVARSDVVTAASSRLRAITLTTITTLGGVFPMAYGIGGESGYTKGIAFTMGWGLLASTIATLYLLPVSVELREDILGGIRRVRGAFSLIVLKLRGPQPPPSSGAGAGAGPGPGAVAAPGQPVEDR